MIPQDFLGLFLRHFKFAFNRLVRQIGFASIPWHFLYVKKKRFFWESGKSEKIGFWDFNPSNWDLTSALWSRMLPPSFGKYPRNIYVHENEQKRPKNELRFSPIICLHRFPKMMSWLNSRRIDSWDKLVCFHTLAFPIQLPSGAIGRKKKNDPLKKIIGTSSDNYNKYCIFGSLIWQFI